MINVKKLEKKTKAGWGDSKFKINDGWIKMN